MQVKKQFIIFQILTNTKQDINIHNINIDVDVAIRNVFADSEEEAIGKFVKDTQDIKCDKKLNISCIDITTLKTL